MLLSGNVHFAEISRDDRSGMIELTSSGMTEINESYGAAADRHRIGEPFIDLNFGLIEIDWKAKAVTLSACGLDRRPVLIEALPLRKP